MNAIERKIQFRLENIEEYETAIKSLETQILDEGHRAAMHLSGYSSHHHVVQCINQAADNINDLEREMNLYRGCLIGEYRKLVEIYKELEA